MTLEVSHRFISLGAGVQSSTLDRMAALGEIPGPMVDASIFADTKSEPKWVYDQLDALERDHGDVIPIIRASRGNLSDDLRAGLNSTGQRFSPVPFWTESKSGGSSPGRRQCTREYKIDVVTTAIREFLGLVPRQRAKGRVRVEQWIGISTDEAARAKPSRVPWIESRWPLLYDVPMRRSDCLEWNRERGFELPKPSACVFCPYRQPIEFARMRVEAPEVFEEACKVDDLIRSNGSKERPQYVLNRLIPLRDLPPLEELDGRDQIDLFDNECEGMCGV